MAEALTVPCETRIAVQQWGQARKGQLMFGDRLAIDVRVIGDSWLGYPIEQNESSFADAGPPRPLIANLEQRDQVIVLRNGRHICVVVAAGRTRDLEC